MYYVYVLLDSSKPGSYQYDKFIFDYEPFYIGKGKGYRIKNTIKDVRDDSFKSKKIRKLLSLNIEIISLKLYEDLTEKDAFEKEIYMIDKIGRINLNKGPLVNTTNGGEGSSGFVYTEEVLIKRSISQTGDKNGFYGKKHTKEVKEKHSKLVSGDSHPMYGKKHKEETIDKLKKHRLENISNDNIKEACQKFNKSVLMYDLEMNFINEYDSVKSCSSDTNINESIISKCCRGDIKSPTRYFFKYKDTDSKIKNNKFILNIGDVFIYQNNKYELIKRNKITCICKDIIKDELKTIHYNEFPILTMKDTNDSDLIELMLYLKSIDRKFKLDGNIITNENISIRYLKLNNNSEVFNDSKFLLGDDSTIIIFEDEWLYKKNIVKSRLRNILNKSNRIYARKCVIKFIEDNSLVREFLINNHIQGYVGSVYKLGLFYDNELVSLMTFGNLRKNLGQKSISGSYELLRFCNKLDTTVIGGASKLLNYFIKNIKINSILSYADKRWSNGNLYEKLGFVKIKSTIPNYFYIVGDKREGRFKYRKDLLIKEGFDPTLTEIQIQHGRGYYRIFDKGSIRYELKI